MNSNSSSPIQRIAVSGVFLAVAVVLNTAFSFYIPMFGESGLRLSLANVFAVIPALLFGPMFGALTAGLLDLISYLLKPTGAFIPIMSIVVAFGGFLRGFIWKYLQNISTKKMRIILTILTVILLGLGAYQAFGLQEGFGLIIASGLLGLLVLVVDLVLEKKVLKKSYDARFLQLLITLLISGLIVTTLNTVVLRETILVAWKSLPFVVVWVPRLFEEILNNIVVAWLVSMLLNILYKQKWLLG
ncbi:MAG: ECF transporter S component [Lachnospiraceae bacterium]